MRRKEPYVVWEKPTWLRNANLPAPDALDLVGYAYYTSEEHGEAVPYVTWSDNYLFRVLVFLSKKKKILSQLLVHKKDTWVHIAHWSPVLYVVPICAAWIRDLTSRAWVVLWLLPT